MLRPEVLDGGPLCTAWIRGMLVSCLWITACGEQGLPAVEDGQPVDVAPSVADVIFEDRAAHLGLDFVHFNGMSGEDYMVEVLGAGGGMIDVDRDGDLDLYLVQGTMLGPGKRLEDSLVPPPSEETLRDRLFRNELRESGELRFVDVTAEAGIPPGGYGMGLAAGDVDNDGFVDIYVTNFDRNRLLRNVGDGTFSDVTDRAGVGDESWSVPATFFDYDRDGWLDLFVGNYVTFDFSALPVCRDPTGAIDYCGPGVFPSAADRLYRNRGDGTFEDVTAAAGLREGFGPALGALAADFDGDGWLDLYVANDARPNNLWRNGGDGTFTDEALLAGCAVNTRGKPEGSMGVDAGDVDGDGDLDLFMTHLSQETNTLYRNDGSGMFEDRTVDFGLASPSQAYTSFGTGFFDYDGDGWLDLLAVNGAVTKIQDLVRRGDPYPLHQPNQLFRNLGGSEHVRFTEVGAEAGPSFDLSEVSRAAAFGDVDNDGDVDVLITNNNGPARLLINTVGSRSRWLGLRLMAGDPARDVPGARAALLVEGRPVRWRRVRMDGSYASVSDPRILFGLEGLPRIDGVRVAWPGGMQEDWNDVAAGRYTTLLRGSGISSTLDRDDE